MLIGGARTPAYRIRFSASPRARGRRRKQHQRNGTAVFLEKLTPETESTVLFLMHIQTIDQVQMRLVA